MQEIGKERLGEDEKKKLKKEIRNVWHLYQKEFVKTLLAKGKICFDNN